MRKTNIKQFALGSHTVDPVLLDTVRQPSTSSYVFVTADVQVVCDKNEQGRVRLLIENANPPTTIYREAVIQETDADAVNARSIVATACLSGWVRPGWRYKIETAALTGAPAFTLLRGGEDVIA